MDDHLKNSLEYQKRINRALVFIRYNLNKTVSLKEVAQAACFSPFHFHRIFSSMMGETLGEYITRKKLERAAIKLAYSPGVSVTELAFDYGYSSVSGFSKAFNNWFGCRPTEVAKIKSRIEWGKGKLQTRYNKSIDHDSLFNRQGTERFDTVFAEIERRVKVKNIPEFELFYLTSPGGYDIPCIKDTWKKLSEILEDNNIDRSRCDFFAISHDHPGLTPPEMCRYDACAALPEESQQKIHLPKTIVPAGRYAVYRVEGPEDTILSKYLEFYTVWMPQSGYEPDDFPVLEHYVDSCKDNHVVVELRAKIKRLSPL